MVGKFNEPYYALHFSFNRFFFAHLCSPITVTAIAHNVVSAKSEESHAAALCVHFNFERLHLGLLRKSCALPSAVCKHLGERMHFFFHSIKVNQLIENQFPQMHTRARLPSSQSENKWSEMLSRNARQRRKMSLELKYLSENGSKKWTWKMLRFNVNGAHSTCPHVYARKLWVSFSPFFSSKTRKWKNVNYHWRVGSGTDTTRHDTTHTCTHTIYLLSATDRLLLLYWAR